MGKLEYIRSLKYEKPFIHPTAYINFHCVTLGEGCTVDINAVVGSSSTSATWDEDGHLVRMPQRGTVKIGDFVYVGANSTIDRSTNDENVTEIGDRTIISPMAHIGHNVKIGKDTLILGNSVICGGAVISDNCMIGVNATIKNKVKIGKGVVVGMGAVVTKDVPDGWTVVGNPARRLEKNESSRHKSSY